MRYFRVKEWSKYQHYKDRSPPWIKLHRELLTSQTWVMLDDDKKALAIACMLLAAATDNKIPMDAGYVQRVAYMKSAPDFHALIKVDFIEIIEEVQAPNGKRLQELADASKPYSEAEQSTEVRSEKKSDTSSTPPTRAKKVSRETSIDPDWWLDFKLAYPNRAGDQGWREAQRAAHARISAGHTTDDLIAGAKRYAEYCEATGNTGTQYVKQAASFLGPENHFLLPWAPPPSKSQLKQDKSLTASQIWLQQQEAEDAAH